ncbi:Thioesterase/thiol ester dehydrase-isomerase [Aspergillus sclerotioniger CBS 115572]|uniref:Thioesterase/thiol ester dehydrase-isomerase n=1 Tax=Aspergillus sclerotioniger CBS 115572 TaxID=1450535 RepID=A0A317WB56_9EURO|nr:Thioesterase/thiol ester dehydrase-isomerase [Aspergillus sclerotioniger CBS 115572]PWY83726.1 Thioesterase/thiol ester dehydrase-isomerase [Aspergillus sclerotioniger CBS 115572]
MSLPRLLPRALPLTTKRPQSLLLLPTTHTHTNNPPIRTIQAATATSASAIETPSSTTTYQHHHHPPPPPHLTPDHLITTHPLFLRLRQNPKYKESRPHLTMNASLRPNHFVAGTLSGSNKVSVPAYMFTSVTKDQYSQRAKILSLFHIGPRLCGHPGYVHGGLLSVMLDETFARCVSDSFPSGLGMTANLNVDFRKPAVPDRVYVLRAETVKVEGRKAWVEGEIRVMPEVNGGKGKEGQQQEEVVVAEARALFVEPKFAEVSDFVSSSMFVVS